MLYTSVVYVALKTRRFELLAIGLREGHASDSAARPLRGMLFCVFVCTRNMSGHLMDFFAGHVYPRRGQGIYSAIAQKFLVTV